MNWKEFYNSFLQKWLDGNDILMYSMHNEGKSVVAERFTSKILKIWVNNKIPYVVCLNKLVDEYNNSYHHAIGKNPTNADDSALTEKNKTNSKLHKFDIGDRVRIT